VSDPGSVESSRQDLAIAENAVDPALELENDPTPADISGGRADESGRDARLPQQERHAFRVGHARSEADN
jgi:hypothetical protein